MDSGDRDHATRLSASLVASRSGVDDADIGDSGPLVPVEVQTRTRRSKRLLLLGSLVVLFVRYYIATFLSAFFPQVAVSLCISDTTSGLTFAAYPAGMAITSIFAPTLISVMGTRMATLVGLSATVVLTLLFGLAPTFAPMPTLQWVMLSSYFLNGALGALAETACIITLTAKFKENPGSVMNAVNNAATIGCLVGPFIGGVLFDAGKRLDIHGDDVWAFRLPFLVSAAVPLALVPLTPCFMPQLHIGASADAASAEGVAEAAADAAAAPTSVDGSGVNISSATGAPKPRAGLSRWMLASPSILLGLASIALSGCLVGTLDPTLAIRLSAPPFLFSPTLISLFFLYSSVVYICVSTPIGVLVDRRPASPRLYKAITASGFVVLSASFALLAPFGKDAFGGVGQSGIDALYGAAGAAKGLQAALNNLPAASAALVLKGAGSALSNAAIYPDLIYRVPDDALLQSTLSALWNAAYAIGWATGPYLGDALLYAFRENALCVDKYARPPFCPAAPDAHGHSHLPPPPPHAVASPPPPPVLPPPPPTPEDCWAPAVSNCSCVWLPDNGFDGFASTTALISLAYAAPLLLAALLNLSGPNSRCHARGSVSADGVAPLIAPPAEDK